MVSVLDDLKKPAIIFANINLEGRQIDFVLILDGSILVFEAKESTLPLEGGENGLWHVIMPSGKKKNIRNFYTQTLEASYAFKNNAEKFFNLKIQYPKAVLVFCNKIFNRSNIRTDFKVSVIDLPDIQKLLRENNSITSINNDQWGSFAKKNKFIKVNSLESALDQDIFDSELIIKNYLFEFEAYYKEDLKGFIEFSCNKEEKKLSSSDLNCFLDKNLLIYGPSGCGKSLLVKSLAL
jgi:hypothetical protein